MQNEENSTKHKGSIKPSTCAHPCATRMESNLGQACYSANE